MKLIFKVTVPSSVVVSSPTVQTAPNAPIGPFAPTGYYVPAAPYAPLATTNPVPPPSSYGKFNPLGQITPIASSSSSHSHSAPYQPPHHHGHPAPSVPKSQVVSTGPHGFFSPANASQSPVSIVSNVLTNITNASFTIKSISAFKEDPSMVEADIDLVGLQRAEEVITSIRNAIAKNSNIELVSIVDDHSYGNTHGRNFKH
ncbi:hypothetical protein [Legionella sp. W05-934-2]|jgi:hypothetical protein|uniref:hypothetical protein n=1 Tax=Legionella sp. W05-934-2 TaxID=1198649 RepID=UPI003461A500